MMNIGISTKRFLGLIGARDFINHFLMGLSFDIEKSNDSVYVFIEKRKKYRNFKGLKRIFEFLKYFFAPKVSIENECEYFENIKNVNFVIYKCDIQKLIKKLKIDCLLLNTDQDISSFNVPVVNYLYDCQHKYYPDFFDKAVIDERNSYFSSMVKNYCIVNSEDVKNDLIKFFGADSNKIFPLPFSPKLKENYLLDNKKSIEKYNLPKKYFLMSNQFWIHKDHKTLFKAFAKFSAQKGNEDIELICTGTMEESRVINYIEELKEFISDLGIKEKVHLLGMIPKMEQIEIMKGAISVIQTTLFEGGAGGGEVVDAVSLGVPCIVSDIKVNKEINCEFVTFFEKGNCDSLCEKMNEALIHKPKTYSREELLKMSEDNCKKLGQRIYEILNFVLKNPN